MAQPLNINIAPLSGISFPKDIGNIGYYMSFTFSEYHRDSILSGANIFMSGGQSINLPMPDMINDHPTVVWNQESMTKKGMDIGSSALSGLANAAGVNSSFLQFGEKAVDLAANFYGWQQGVAINPFLIMMFKEPAFKKFTFSWILSPRSSDESDTLNNILKTFRKNMLPDTGGQIPGGVSLGPVLLKYPMIVKPVFHPDEYLFKFKHCAINEINFDYTGMGMPAFTTTDAPAAVKLDIAMTEIDLWFRSDPALTY